MLWSTVKTIKAKSSTFAILFSSLIGTIAGVLVPLTKFSGVFLILIKVVVGALMVLSSFKQKSFKEFFIAFLIFVSYTFLMGGACYAIIILLGGNLENISIGQYDALLPVSIVILVCFIYSFIIFRLTKYLYRKKDMLPFMKEVDIVFGGKSYSFRAFLDSGNRLYDKSSNFPVIILSAAALEKFISNDEIVKLVFGEKSDVFSNVHFLSYNTVGDKAKKMVVFSPSSVSVRDESGVRVFSNVCVGVTFKKFNDAINYDCLLHPSIC